MSEIKHTSGPWETFTGEYGKNRTREWQIVKHDFPDYPYEGDLVNEWGIYPPLGEGGPVALVAGEEDARFIVRAANAHDDLLAVLERWQALFPGDHTGSPHFVQLIIDTRAAIAAAKGGER